MEATKKNTNTVIDNSYGSFIIEDGERWEDGLDGLDVGHIINGDIVVSTETLPNGDYQVITNNGSVWEFLYEDDPDSIAGNWDLVRDMY